MPQTDAYLEIFKQLGIAGLFIAMYLTTVYYFYRELKEHKNELKEIGEKSVSALERSTRSIEDSTDILGTVKEGLEASKAQTSEFIAFLKGRDARG